MNARYYLITDAQLATHLRPDSTTRRAPGAMIGEWHSMPLGDGTHAVVVRSDEETAPSDWQALGDARDSRPIKTHTPALAARGVLASHTPFEAGETLAAAFNHPRFKP